nr:hypothetical protein [Pandoravirus aubagnensis]
MARQRSGRVLCESACGAPFRRLEKKTQKEGQQKRDGKSRHVFVFFGGGPQQTTKIVLFVFLEKKKRQRAVRQNVRLLTCPFSFRAHSACIPQRSVFFLLRGGYHGKVVVG